LGHRARTWPKEAVIAKAEQRYFFGVGDCAGESTINKVLRIVAMASSRAGII